MKTLAIHYSKQINESYLLEMTDNREDIMTFVRELADIFEEYNQQVLGLEDGYLIEAQLAGNLSVKQITQLFRAASAFSKGENYKKGMFTKAGEKLQAGKDVIQKTVDKVKAAAKSLQNTEPVQMFDMKIADMIAKVKNSLGEDSEIVKKFRTLGEIGKNNPKKTAFIIGAMTALMSVFGTPAFGAAAGTALGTAINLAKGERASGALGGGVATAAGGATLGQIGKGLGIR